MSSCSPAVPQRSLRCISGSLTERVCAAGSKDRRLQGDNRSQAELTTRVFGSLVVIDIVVVAMQVQGVVQVVEYRGKGK